MSFVAENVFDLLPEMMESHDPNDKFDFIILDPPAFTKSRKPSTRLPADTKRSTCGQ